MYRKILFASILIFVFNSLCSQENRYSKSVSLHVGFGKEFNAQDYTFTNQYYKLQLNYLIKNTKSFTYELVIATELNLATHQLINPYFITSDYPDYIRKREYFTKKLNINQYILNLGFLVRKPISKEMSFFFLVSTGPIILDQETERLSKGFAFSSIVGLGVSCKIQKFTFDFMPNLGHVSNAGLSKPNGGYNTENFEFGLSFPF